MLRRVAAAAARRNRQSLNQPVVNAVEMVELLEMRRMLAYALRPGEEMVHGGACGCPSCRVGQQYMEMQQAQQRQQQQAATARSGSKRGAGVVDSGPQIDPGGLSPDGNAYQIGGRWTGTASGPTGTPGSGATITYSIVPDGTVVGQNGVGEPLSGSTFRANMNAIYGSIATWLPIVQRVFNDWAAISGINFVYEPNDDGAAWLSSFGQLGVRGDMRISAHPIDGGSGVLAYNFFPNTGDMVVDSNDLQAGGFMFGTANQSRNLRNVMMHEAGHGIGFNHVDPINQTKLMEAFASSAFDGAQLDDRLAVQRNYGDMYEKQAAPNNTFTNAVDRGSLGDGTDNVVNVSTRDNSDQDWFKFTIASSKSVTVTVTPEGAPYMQGPQGGATSLFTPASQGNLQVALFAADGTTQLAIANTTAIGLAETINGLNLGAGTYFIRVNHQAGSPSNTQPYTLATTISQPQAQAIIVGVSPDPRSTTVSSIAINFNEAVNGFDIDDLTLTRDGFTESLAGATLQTANNINFTLTGLDAITNRIGAYTLTLNAAGSGITTQNGSNPLINNATEAWYMNTHVGTNDDEVIRFALNGSLTDVFVNNNTATPTYSFTSAGITTLAVNGGAGDDVLVMDYTNGNFAPVNGTTWNGGAHVNGDTIRVIAQNTTDTFNMSTTTITRTSPASPSITLSGNEIFDLNKGTYTAFTDLNQSLIANASTTVNLNSTQHHGFTTARDGALVRLGNSGFRTLVTGALSIDANSRLDLFNNFLIVNYNGATPITTIEGLISSGRSGGTWNGRGIVSSNARVAEVKNVTIGAMEATDYKSIYGPGATFNGEAIDDTAVVAMYTYYGDTDFNGVVNFDDYSRTDAGFNGARTGWFNGDFDMNGLVNFDDYSLIDLAFNTQEV